MPTWKINLKEQTATSVKERYHLQSQKLTSEWMEERSNWLNFHHPPLEKYRE